MADALAFNRLYTSKGKKGPTYLRTMALYPAAFCVVILRKVLPPWQMAKKIFLGRLSQFEGRWPISMKAKAMQITDKK